MRFFAADHADRDARGGDHRPRWQRAAKGDRRRGRQAGGDLLRSLAAVLLAIPGPGLFGPGVVR
jgi:hypothetical protein